MTIAPPAPVSRPPRRQRLRGMSVLVGLCLLSQAACTMLTPAYWECRRQWERDRVIRRDDDQSRLTRRMIEAGEHELRDLYMEACLGRL